MWRLENRDIGPLQSIITDPSVGNYWRNRGSYWAPYQVQAMLGREVLVSAIATLGPGREDPLVGLVEALDPSLVDGRAQLTAIVAPAFLSTGLGIEMVLGFVQWVFASYPLEKFQLEVQAENRRLMPGLERLLSHEGTFRRHLHVLGEWRDVEVFALWKEDLPRLMAVLQGLPSSPSGAVSSVGLRSRVEQILDRELLDAPLWDVTPLTEIDSLLVLELLFAAEECVGHEIDAHAFPPDTSTLGDLVRFCRQAAV